MFVQLLVDRCDRLVERAFQEYLLVVLAFVFQCAQ
jgi:hypothetical protein